MPGTGRILIIEDDEDTRANLCDILEMEGYEVELASQIDEALSRTDWPDYTAILLDRYLPDGTAEELLPTLSELAPDAAVIVVTGHADIEGTVAAMQHGVADYILKPIAPEVLLTSLKRIVRVRVAEERAQRAERLAAIGEMMTVLVHESRNAFQLAGASLDMLAWNLEEQPEQLELIDRVRKHQDRVSRLFEDVRGYAAPIQLDRSFVDITSVLRDSADQIRALHSSRGVRIDVSSLSDPSEPTKADIDVFRMDQVFRNLMENSIAACTDPVEIGIACAITQSEHESMIQLRYQDNGPGLSDDCRRHIFEPFYTTKPKGTGLGMAITRRIVEAHGGTIEAVAREGQSGAEFHITLPAGEVPDTSHSP